MIGTGVPEVNELVSTTVSRPQLVAAVAGVAPAQSFSGALGVPATKRLVPCSTAMVAPPGIGVGGAGTEEVFMSTTEMLAATPPHSGPQFKT